MVAVRVRSYTRRSPSLSLRDLKRFPRIPLRLHDFIDEVTSGKRSGFTWTSRWKFDVNDPANMEQVYDGLGDRTMYVVATTNRKLDDLWGVAHWRISSTEGIGLWRDDDGTIYADDIVLFFGPKVSEKWALDYAKKHAQRFVLKVDGKARGFEFLAVQ